MYRRRRAYSRVCSWSLVAFLSFLGVLLALEGFSGLLARPAADGLTACNPPRFLVSGLSLLRFLVLGFLVFYRLP